jgi:hypothetical protein
MTNAQLDLRWVLAFFMVFNPLKMFTPIHIGYIKFTWEGGSSREYKSLHILGLRVARWRTNT